MSVTPLNQWRMAGCGDLCSPRQHDPDAHETYGYRMAQERPVQSYFEVGNLCIDTTSCTVTRHGAVVPLSAREWEILAYLLDHADQWCKPRDVEMAVWNDRAENAFRVTLSRLRGKLEDDRTVILNRPAYGYMLRVDTTRLPPVSSIPERRTGGRWARDHDACVWCKRTDRAHSARGLCYSCQGRQKHAGKFI